MIDYKPVLKKPSHYGEQYIKKYYPEFYQYLTVEYPDDLSFRERIYWYLHDLTSHPVCKKCGKPTKFNSMSHGYFNYCSLKCSNNDESIKIRKKNSMTKNGVYGNPEKMRKTKLERYGDEHYTNPEKRKKTCLEKYGVEHVMSTTEFQERSRKTRKEKYGDEHYTNPEKRKKTCLERYGVEHVMSTTEFQERSRKTRKEKYGDEHYSNSEKRKKTCLERYGAEQVFSLDDVKKKIKNTILEKYGVEYPSQNKDISGKIKEAMRIKILSNKPDVLDARDNGDCYEYICSCPHPECNKCEERTFAIPALVHYFRTKSHSELCTKLVPVQTNKISNTSIESHIRLILDKHHIEYQTNVRDVIPPKELDIYIPSHNLAIECNGIHWHSSNFNHTPKDKHYKKYTSCREKGIQLLTFWEDQIIYKLDILESILMSKLNIYNERIYARKCEIREVSSKECDTFLENNHLQGIVRGSVRLGLYEGEILRSVMVFGKTRKCVNGKEEWELYRFCNLNGNCVVGGASKLFKYFVSHYHPNNIVSFSSNDISNGDLYKILGFDKVGESVSYWYIDKEYNRHHRYNFTKHKLISMGYDKDKSEISIMTELGFYQIYDSGQTKWIWTE